MSMHTYIHMSMHMSVRIRVSTLAPDHAAGAAGVYDRARMRTCMCACIRAHMYVCACRVPVCWVALACARHGYTDRRCVNVHTDIVVKMFRNADKRYVYPCPQTRLYWPEMCRYVHTSVYRHV